MVSLPKRCAIKNMLENHKLLCKSGNRTAKGYFRSESDCSIFCDSKSRPPSSLERRSASGTISRAIVQNSSAMSDRNSSANGRGRGDEDGDGRRNEPAQRRLNIPPLFRPFLRQSRKEGERERDQTTPLTARPRPSVRPTDGLTPGVVWCTLQQQQQQQQREGHHRADPPALT